MDQRTSAIGTASFLKSWAFYSNREWIKSVISRIIISRPTWNDLENSNVGIDVADVARRNRIMGMVRAWEKEGYIRILEERDAKKSEPVYFGETITGVDLSEMSSILMTRDLRIHTLLSDMVEMKRILAQRFSDIRVLSSLELLKVILATRTGYGNEDHICVIETNLRSFAFSVGPLMDEAVFERTVEEIYEKGKKNRFALYLSDNTRGDTL